MFHLIGLHYANRCFYFFRAEHKLIIGGAVAGVSVVAAVYAWRFFSAPPPPPPTPPPPPPPAPEDNSVHPDDSVGVDLRPCPGFIKLTR